MASSEPTRVAALIYDMDDTIVQSERINDELFSGLLRMEYGIDLSQGELDEVYGFAWSGVFEWLKERRGLVIPRQEVWTRFLEVKGAFRGTRRLRAATGFDRMLALPVPQAIVSGSTREEIRMILENIGLSKGSVQFILSDEDCARGKPDPEGFLLALQRLGSRAEETLVFEDSPAGIQAARHAGIPVAFVAELASRDSGALADLRFETFLDASSWVRERIASRTL